GQTTGTKTTMCTLTTLETAITCTTVDIHGIGSQSASMRSKVNSVACGGSIGHIIGGPSTATGSNAGATTATAFQRPVTLAILVRLTRSVSTAILWRRLMDIPASSTTAFRSVSLIRGLNTGQTT